MAFKSSMGGKKKKTMATPLQQVKARDPRTLQTAKGLTAGSARAKLEMMAGKKIPNAIISRSSPFGKI